MKFNDNRPIFLQIVEMVEDNIAKGGGVSGGRIPSTRELSVELAVNPATVMRAYEQLTERGLIEQQRGLGYFVSTGALERIYATRREEFFSRTLPDFFAQMEHLGVGVDQVVSLYDKYR